MITRKYKADDLQALEVQYLRDYSRGLLNHEQLLHLLWKLDRISACRGE